MTLRNTPPSIQSAFNRAAYGTSPSTIQGRAIPAPEAKQSLDMPGPDGHAVRQNRFQSALAHMKARLTQSMPDKGAVTPSRLDTIRKAFYEKAGITPKSSEKNVGGQQQ